MEDVDELESLLEDLDLGEFDERARRPRTRQSVPTPSSRSSFQARQAPTAASQGQVQAAARNLDIKIETLSKAVKALETRTTSLSADQARTSAALAKEIAERKKNTDGLRGDLRQANMMALILPMLSQGKNREIQVTENDKTETITVPTVSDNDIAKFLPFLLLMGGTGTEPGKGGLDTNMLLLFALLGNKDK